MRLQKPPAHSVFLVPSVHNRVHGDIQPFSKTYRTSGVARYLANYPKSLEKADKEAFKKAFAAAWEDAKHVETLVLIYALATQGSYNTIRYLNREDLYPDLNCVHVKYPNGDGKIMPIHPGLMLLLKTFFATVDPDVRQPLMNYFAHVKHVLNSRFGMTYDQVKNMQINKE